MFAALWRTDELLTSFDGLALTRPFGLAPEHRPHQVFHYDRGPQPDPQRWHYLQGFVNLIPTDRTTGGNVLLAGTHRRFGSLVAEHRAKDGDEAAKGLTGAGLCVCHPAGVCRCSLWSPLLFVEPFKRAADVNSIEFAQVC